MEKNVLLFELWQCEILCIVCKVSQYFYLQKQIQVMNEGWVIFWYYIIFNYFYDEGKVIECFMLEFFYSYINVVFQLLYNSLWYSGINFYVLGFVMFQDIKCICQLFMEEDKYWFFDIVGFDWLEMLYFVMCDFKDESFISQFLLLKIMCDFCFFIVFDDDYNNYLEILVIYNEEGYCEICNKFFVQYNFSNFELNIQVWNVDLCGD